MGSHRYGVLLAHSGATERGCGPTALQGDWIVAAATSALVEYPAQPMIRLRDVSLTVLDATQFGESGAGCVYLLRDAKNALIDTGTADNAPRLLQALRGIRLDYAFVTHIHLDHAGAAGHVAAAHPETSFVVHPRGLPHLADPARLVAGVRAASPDLAPLYGEPRPIDRARLIPCVEGDSFALGRNRLLVVETPGHAPHHVSFYEPASGVLFAGDAVGHHGAPVKVPLTVPPRFDLAASRASIRRLLELRPQTLAFTHFGLAENAGELLTSYPENVETWLARVADLLVRVGEDNVADVILAEPRHAALSPIGRNVVRLCVRGALLTLHAATLREDVMAPDSTRATR
ncbi:MAG: MBL fold metallo-hydrolase [Candidatus Bipolaricaulota bacterium]|nr:MBL fold metallo-hydrolase [Candidatus Bipolaricaulota bacterium]